MAPVMVTEVPPAGGAATGLTPVTAGGPSKAYRSAELVALVPLEDVTVTSTVPASAGVVAVSSLDELTE